tara:strand:- start:155 stop:325 length:171 start_codon:yes stop_codon:yes gene_type:complete
MEKTRMIHIRVSETLHREIRLLCADKDITIQKYVNDLISNDLVNLKKKGGRQQKKK